MCLAVETRTPDSSYLRLVNWMYLHPGIDIQSGIRTQSLTHMTTEIRQPLTCVTSKNFNPNSIGLDYSFVDNTVESVTKSTWFEYGS